MRPLSPGGVSVKEVNPSTLESKLVNGLYFCRRGLDLDAVTGALIFRLPGPQVSQQEVRQERRRTKDDKGL